MIGLRPILSDRPAEEDEEAGADEESDGNHDIGSLAVDLQHVLQEEQGVELAAIPDDGLAHGGAEQREQGDLGIAPLAESLRQRRLRTLALGLHLLERRRFVHLQTDPDGNAEQDEGDEERNAPAPGRERFLAHRYLDAARMTISDRNRPSVAVVWIHEVK